MDDSSMVQAARESIDGVRNDLARTLRSIRSDCIPHETARRLLEYDRPGHTALVGLDARGEKAVLYHETGRYAIAVPFGADGLADGGTEIADFRRGPGVAVWFRKMRHYWGWVHPRYR